MSKKSKTLTLTILPFLFIVFMVFRFGVDIPFYDEWDFIPTIDKYLHHTLTLADLWAPHNGQILVPILVMLALIHIDRWNNYHELAVSLILATGILGVLIYQVRKTLSEVAIHGSEWLLPTLSVIVFSLAQWSNWLQGCTLSAFLTLLTVVLGIVLLAKPEIQPGSFLAAVVLGLIATCTLGNGLVYWVTGAFLLIVGRDLMRVRLWLILWSLVSLTVFVLYAHGLKSTGAPPTSGETVASVGTLSRLVHYCLYIPIYMGSLVVAIQKPPLAPPAFCIGIVGVLFFGYAVRRLSRTTGVGFRRIAPYVGFGLFALLSSLLTGLARADFGFQQALASRYTTFSMLLWISNIVFLWLLIQKQEETTQVPSPRWLQSDRLVIYLKTLVTVLVIGSLLNSYSFWHVHRRLVASRDQLMTQLRTGDTNYANDNIKFLYPRIEFMQNRLDTLKRDHLAMFRGDPQR